MDRLRGYLGGLCGSKERPYLRSPLAESMDGGVASTRRGVLRLWLPRSGEFNSNEETV
jgi:hypothetical protein